MEIIPITQQVNTPAIRKYEITKNHFPGVEPFYVRTKYGQTFAVDSFEELWEHFCSEDGYRISFPIGDGNYDMWLYKNSSDEEIEEAVKQAQEISALLDAGHFGEIVKKEMLEDRTIWHFEHGGTMEIFS